MDKASGKLTVYFEEPFWVGVFERIEDGKLSVAKVTFGAEPNLSILLQTRNCFSKLFAKSDCKNLYKPYEYSRVYSHSRACLW